ncbi:Suf-domain-containing protein [Hymenopellis radicata]|nr:Suf-domain-containing protein [Hymenopellis radicata]
MPPQFNFEELLADLNAKPHQPILWRRLLDIAQDTHDPTIIKKAYRALLKQYPDTASAQIAYLNRCFTDPSHAEPLFHIWLKRSPSVDLFSLYLYYIRSIHADPTSTDPEKRKTIRQAFEFALNPPHGIGHNKDSGTIWLEYIDFLREEHGSTISQKQQNMDALRKVYHRAVQIPLNNVERLWQDLQAFEIKLNPITATKFISQLSPAHMRARTVYSQLMNHLSNLSATETQDTCLPTLPTFSQEERMLVGKWKSYLKWEESNPLHIQQNDNQFLILRLQTVYRQAVLRMRYYPEIWFMAYLSSKRLGNQHEAKSIMKNGREANPLSHVLTYAYVESLELDNSCEEAETVYKAFLSNLASDLDATENNLDTAAATNGFNSIREPTSETSKRSDANSSNNDELREKRQEYSVAYINYMQFIRRTKGFQEARLIFKEARKDKHVTWHVYEASAMIEYHFGTNNQVPTNIFITANSSYGNDAEFVIHYLNYLLSIDDEKNARTLFEESTQRFTPDVARPIWERWAKYQYEYGDLEASLSLQKRMAEAFPNDPPIKRFAFGHIHLNIDAIANRDLGFALARKAPLTSQPLPPPDKQSGSVKRPASPNNDYRKNADNPGNHKHAHGKHPRRRNDELHRRRDIPPTQQRAPPPPQRHHKEPESVVIPEAVHWFQAQLPPASAFTLPVVSTDYLMQLLRDAVIPASVQGHLCAGGAIETTAPPAPSSSSANARLCFPQPFPDGKCL